MVFEFFESKDSFVPYLFKETGIEVPLWKIQMQYTIIKVYVE